MTARILFSPPEITEDDIAMVAKVLRSGWLTTGPVNAAFEKELADYVQIPFVSTLNSCTAALEVAVRYAKLGVGSRVAVPTWTFVSSVTAASRYGVTPVLLDVDPDTLNVSLESLEAALADGVDAVIGVHFAGNPLPDGFWSLTTSHGVKVIEDCAHFLGARAQTGVAAGKSSIAACFSFYATKNLVTGEGGALATADEALDSFCREHRLHGLTGDAWKRYLPGQLPAYDVREPGLKANMPDVLAALGRSQLARFPERQEFRRTLVRRYREHLATVPSIRVVPAELNEESSDHLMIVVLPASADRQRVATALAEAGVSVSIHFRPVHSFSFAPTTVEIVATGVACADDLAPRVLSLPLHVGMSLDDVDFVCSQLEAALSVQGFR